MPDDPRRAPTPEIDDEPLAHDVLDDFDEDDLDDSLADPDAWPDDDEPPEADIIDEPVDDPDALDDLSVVREIDDEPIDDPTLLDEPELDDQGGDDLLIPDDAAALPVIGALLTITWVEEHRAVAAVTTPSAALSEWEHPGAAPGAVQATLDVAGVQVRVTLHQRDGSPERIRLGADALAGRFLIRP